MSISFYEPDWIKWLSEFSHQHIWLMVFGGSCCAILLGWFAGVIYNATRPSAMVTCYRCGLATKEINAKHIKTTYHDRHICPHCAYYMNWPKESKT